MNQLEYEELFREEEPRIAELPIHILTFSQGNHKRSLVGDEWYYYGETYETYSLYKDKVIRETSDHVFIDIYEENTRLNSTPIGIEKNRLHKLYPVQELFPRPMGQEEAREILRKHFIKEEERSTAIENIDE